MATWRAENSMLTQRGVEILNKLKSGVGSITITRVVAGSGRVSESLLYTQTSVKGVQKQMTVSSKHTNETGSEIAFYISNDDFTESYDIHQLGVYVTHPDYEGEQLYHISQCDGEDFDTIPALEDTPVTQGYSIYMEHGNSDAITLVVDPQGVVSRQEFEEYTKKSAFGRFSIKSNNMTALSSAGWYRISSTDYSNSGNLNALLFLGHNFSNGGASGLIVSVNLQIYAPSIVVLNHKISNLQFFDKIRLVYDEVNSKCHIDIHYNSSLANAVVAGIMYLDYNTPVNTLELTMKDFVVVEDEPVDENILLTQTLLTTNDGTVLTSGGGTVTGDLNLKGDYTRLSFSDSSDRTAFLEKSPTTSKEFRIYNVKDSNNRSLLVLNPETSSEDELLRLITLVGGVTSQRKVIHTGNMNNFVAPVGLVHSTNGVNTNELITSTIIGWINSMPENHIRNYILNISVEGLVLTGGKWFLTINKATNTHASIVATRYDVSGAIVRVCSLINGSLTAWTSFTSSTVVPATVEE